MVGRLVNALIGIVVGLAMVPTVVSTVDGLDTLTLSSAEQSLVDLIPVLYIILIVAGAVGYLALSSKNM